MVNGWKRSQTSSGFYRKKVGKLPEFIRFERVEYKNYEYEVIYKKGLGDRPSKRLGYFKSSQKALSFARSYMRKN